MQSIKSKDAWNTVTGSLDMSTDIQGVEGWERILEVLDGAYWIEDTEEVQKAFDEAFDPPKAGFTTMRQYLTDTRTKWSRMERVAKFKLPSNLKSYLLLR